MQSAIASDNGLHEFQAGEWAFARWDSAWIADSSNRNITIATFSEFGFYKKEGYESNLWAGKILAAHGVPIAYKSVSF